ncbi:MAG TPA: hypothetical protein DD477_11100 [Spirochaetaceae bacterium]|nr:hypothetical protein [Spirochaetaceae bacterium]
MKLAGLTAVALACLALGRLPPLLSGSSSLQGRPAAGYLALTALVAAGQVLLLVWASRRLDLPPTGDLAGRQTAVWWRPLAALAVFIVMGLLQASLTGLGGASQAAASPLVSSGSRSPAWIVAAALFAIGIGCQEELLYRRYLADGLDSCLADATNDGDPAGGATRSRLKAELASSLLFGFGHLYQGWSGGLAAFVAGWLLCRLYRRGRDWPSLALGHAAWDFFVLMMRA